MRATISTSQQALYLKRWGLRRVSDRLCSLDGSKLQARDWREATLGTVRCQAGPESYNDFELFMRLRWQDRFRRWLSWDSVAQLDPVPLGNSSFFPGRGDKDTQCQVGP